jgi:hypothetical protein
MTREEESMKKYVNRLLLAAGILIWLVNIPMIFNRYVLETVSLSGSVHFMPGFSFYDTLIYTVEIGDHKEVFRVKGNSFFYRKYLPWQQIRVTVTREGGLQEHEVIECSIHDEKRNISVYERSDTSATVSCVYPP